MEPVGDSGLVTQQAEAVRQASPVLQTLLAEYREREADKRQLFQAIFAVTGVLVAAMVLATSAAASSEPLPFALTAPLVLGATWLVIVLRSFALGVIRRSAIVEQNIGIELGQPDLMQFEVHDWRQSRTAQYGLHSIRYFVWLGWASGAVLLVLGALSILGSALMNSLGSYVPLAIAALYLAWNLGVLVVGILAWRAAVEMPELPEMEEGALTATLPPSISITS
jgi:hypothetical protein